jgi:predicted HTH transcriptional regulator
VPHEDSEQNDILKQYFCRENCEKTCIIQKKIVTLQPILITNAGAPLNDINRLIDLPPQSRNETLAQTMFLLGICERRGSGIDRAVEAVEKMNLPAVKFTKSDQHTRVFLFPQKSLKEMTKPQKTTACY